MSDPMGKGRNMADIAHSNRRRGRSHPGNLCLTPSGPSRHAFHIISNPAGRYHSASPGWTRLFSQRQLWGSCMLLKPNDFNQERRANTVEQFPDTTYPDHVNENPVVAAGSNSYQTSPPKYPSPWTGGVADPSWQDAYAKAKDFVSQLTLEEKVNLTTGTGWQVDRCVGQASSRQR